MNARQQQKYNELVELALKNDMLVLSTTFNSVTPMTFQCLINNTHIKNVVVGAYRSHPKCYKCDNKKIRSMKKFYDNIAKLGGKIVGEYINCDTPVACLCIKLHACSPTPYHINHGDGMCVKCAGDCPIEAAERFKENIEKLGCTVIGQYFNCDTPVKCICVNKHECYPMPTNVQKGRGMCIKCADKCPIQAAENFKNNIEKLGVVIIGKYINCDTPVDCLCSKNHECQPTPTHIQQDAQNMCYKCIKAGYSKVALEWLSFFEPYMEIQHAENKGEYKIKLSQPILYWKNHLALDGYNAKYNLCWEFSGCVYHGCNECKYSKITHNYYGQSMEDLRNKTIAKNKLIKDLGYNLIVIKECVYRKLKSEHKLEEYAKEIISSYI